MSENETDTELVTLRIVFRGGEDSLKGLEELMSLWREKYVSLDYLGQKQAELVSAFGYWGSDQNREFIVTLEKKCNLSFFAACMNKSLEQFEFVQ